MGRASRRKRELTREQRKAGKPPRPRPAAMLDPLADEYRVQEVRDLIVHAETLTQVRKTRTTFAAVIRDEIGAPLGLEWVDPSTGKPVRSEGVTLVFLGGGISVAENLVGESEWSLTAGTLKRVP